MPKRCRSPRKMNQRNRRRLNCSIYDLFKTSAERISILFFFFYAVSSHKKILCNTKLAFIWSMGKCSAMQAVHQKIDVDSVSSARGRNALAKYRVRMHQKTLRKTTCLSVKCSCRKIDVEHHVFTTFSRTKKHLKNIMLERSGKQGKTLRKIACFSM